MKNSCLITSLTHTQSVRVIVQKTAAVALAAVMAVMTAGCGAKGQPAGDATGTKDGTKQTTGANPGTADAAKGRYVEQAVAFPFEDGTEGVLDIIQDQNGEMVLFTLVGQETEGKKKAYRYDGSTWKEDTASPVKELPDSYYLAYSAYGPDGTLYAVCSDSDYKAHLIKLADGQPMQEMSVGIEDAMVLLNGIYVSDDSTILIPSNDQVIVVSPDGTVEKKLPQKSSFSNFCDSHTLTAHTFLTTGDRGFLRYDLKSLAEKEVIPFQTDETDLYGSLAGGDGDDFYLANAKGIHHMSDQGTMWETVVDGSLNSMGMPSVYIKRLLIGSDHDFYLWYTESEEQKLARYTYDAEMPAVPSKTLTVYGLNLSENQTVKQAASLFQMEHPDVRVELIDGNSESGSTLKSDTIRSLNAELLNGSGADVLVLDGLPVESYIEKGVLEDLGDMITPMAESGELYPNIAENFTGSDGSVYQFPVRVGIPVIYGNEAVIKEMGTIGSLRAWQEAHPDQAVFFKTVYENILRQMIYLYYPELAGKDAGQLDTDKVRNLLETAKITGDAGGSKTVFDESEDGGRGQVYNSTDTRGFTGLGDYGLLTKTTEVSLMELASMMDVMSPSAMIDKYGYHLEQFNDIYYPKGLLGVTSFGKEKETAREFVKFALSPKVQEGDLRDGFTVSRTASDAWKKRTSNMSISFSFNDTGEMLSAEYPNDKKKEEIMGMLDKLHTPISVDDILLEMIVSETKGYFEGKQTAAEAAGLFENKAKLYYAE